MNIGFIGIGSMGSLMCVRLLQSEYQYRLIVHDAEPARMETAIQNGAIKAKSPKEVAQNADVIITMLPESTDTQQVILDKDGILEAARPGQIIIDMGTGSPSILKELSRLLAAKQALILDAPVSGGVAKAASGELSIMVSGDTSAFERCREILRVMGKEIFYISPQVGTGHTVKVINNMVQGVNLAAICEAMVLAVKAGLDPVMFMEILNKSSGESYASKVKVPGFILKRNFASGFKAALQYKDMNLASSLAKELKVPLFMGNLAKEYYMAAMASGKGDQDASIIVTQLEDLTSVTVQPLQ